MTSVAYYNENDPKCCAWLAELMAAGLIAPGRIDNRSIADVRPSDLEGFERVHFFAGIGGWDIALQLARWTGPVWTASCPCQPFSLSGHQKGTNDHRDLWPVFARLPKQSPTPVIVGEQVVEAIRWGWLDRAFDDLEAADYSVGAAILPTSIIGAAHQRKRLYWIAVANSSRLNRQPHDCVVSGRGRESSTQLGRFPRVSVAGRWWTAGEGTQPMPTLVRNFDGLSSILAGFGNAIVPQVAAEFVMACREAMRGAA